MWKSEQSAFRHGMFGQRPSVVDIASSDRLIFSRLLAILPRESVRADDSVQEMGLVSVQETTSRKIGDQWVSEPRDFAGMR